MMYILGLVGMVGSDAEIEDCGVFDLQVNLLMEIVGCKCEL